MYTYYAGFEDGTTITEIARMETERYTVTIPVYEGGDANNDLKSEVDVEIVCPVGYALSEGDHARIDELLYEER